MKYCSKCGAELMDEAVICPKCGCTQEGYQPQKQKTEMTSSERARQARLAKQEKKRLNKKPIYKKWWFWVIIAFVVLIIIVPKSNSNESTPDNRSQNVEVKADKPNVTPKPTPEPITYTHYNVTELFDDLEGNALRAEKAHQNEYVEIEGYLSVIDSDGKYISVGADPDDYSYILDSVHCTIKNDSQRDIIMDMNAKDKLIVRGKITSIGEVLGYMLDIDSVEKAS